MKTCENINFAPGRSMKSIGNFSKVLHSLTSASSRNNSLFHSLTTATSGTLLTRTNSKHVRQEYSFSFLSLFYFCCLVIMQFRRELNGPSTIQTQISLCSLCFCSVWRQNVGRITITYIFYCDATLKNLQREKGKRCAVVCGCAVWCGDIAF